MNSELRERLGKALQEKRRERWDYWEWPWEKITEEARENDRACAEAVILSFVELFLPTIRNMLTEDEIERLVKGLE